MALKPFGIFIASCLSLCDPLCKALHHSRFPHTRGANEAGVVPRAATPLEKSLSNRGHELDISYHHYITIIITIIIIIIIHIQITVTIGFFFEDWSWDKWPKKLMQDLCDFSPVGTGQNRRMVSLRPRDLRFRSRI